METNMQAEAAVDMDGPVELDDLDRAVLWAMRSVAVGRLDCPSLRRTFLDLYGPAADQILCALLVMVRLLASRAAGGLRMHMPGSSAVSRDELLILSALAIVQEEAHGAAARRVAAELTELLGGRIDASLTSAIHYVAELLSNRGRRLSAPEPARPPAGGAGLSHRTFH
jgi:hypothetical protein